MGVPKKPSQNLYYLKRFMVEFGLKVIEKRLKRSYNKHYETSIIAISPKGRNIDEICICFVDENISGERSNRKRCISAKTDLWKAVLIFPDGQLQENDARKRKFVRCKINFYGGTFTYNHTICLSTENSVKLTGDPFAKLY